MNHLLSLIKNQFKLDLYGDHGIYHWQRVEKIGMYLFEGQEVDTEVMKLFALLHDAKRESEFYDPEHGLRASSYVQELYNKKFLNITAQQLKQLLFACKHHSDSKIKSDDITIQTCWDSDRLDLWRIGITPVPKYLLTRKARTREAIEFSQRLYREFNSNGII